MQSTAKSGRCMGLVMATAMAAAVVASSGAEAENNCFAGDFVDLRGLQQIVVANNDPGNTYKYRPRCAKVTAGTVVRFEAIPSFGVHPLYGGTIEDGMPVMDPGSPIGSILSGTSAERLLDTAGEFPFYCDAHYTLGMQGSILVLPEQIFVNGFE